MKTLPKSQGFLLPVYCHFVVLCMTIYHLNNVSHEMDIKHIAITVVIVLVALVVYDKFVKPRFSAYEESYDKI